MAFRLVAPPIWEGVPSLVGARQGRPQRVEVRGDRRAERRGPSPGDVASQTRDEKAHRRRLGLTPIEGALSSPEADRVRSRLKRMFDRQIRVSRSHGRFQVFLELWAGSGRAEAALRRLGWGTVSLDIRDGWEGDIMSTTVMSVLRGWITSNAVAGVFVNPPCETWGAHRVIFADETGVGVRSPAHVAGRPGLNPCARAAVKANNAYARRVAEVVRLGVRSFVPTLVVHPAHSLFWEYAPIRALASLPRHREAVCDFCQFGAPWRRRTKVQSWFAVSCLADGRLCTGRRGICSRTVVPHTPITGSRRSRTARELPWQLAHRIAETLVESASFLKLEAMRSRFI